MKSHAIAFLALALLLPSIAHGQAGVVGKAAQEAAEFLIGKFGREVAKEGAEALAGRIATAAARYGDDAIRAVKAVGPRALSLADEAGANAPKVIQLLARHGDDAARVLAHPSGMSIFSRYGDEAVEILIKHKGVAEPLVENLGQPALGALNAVGAQNGRRLAMMAQGGELAAIGRTPDLMGVITKHGDKACDFIYRNRAVLAGGAALTAFLANPQPYLDGVNHLAGTVGEHAVRPAVTAAGNAANSAVTAVGSAASSAVSFVSWALALGLLGAIASVAWGIQRGVHRNPAFKAALRSAREHIAKRFPRTSAPQQPGA